MEQLILNYEGLVWLMVMQRPATTIFYHHAGQTRHLLLHVRTTRQFIICFHVCFSFQKYFCLFFYFKLIFLHHFDVLILKIIFLKKYFFNIFSNKKYFKNYHNHSLNTTELLFFLYKLIARIWTALTWCFLFLFPYWLLAISLNLFCLSS